jgi:hypothetical protein
VAIEMLDEALGFARIGYTQREQEHLLRTRRRQVDLLTVGMVGPGHGLIVAQIALRLNSCSTLPEIGECSGGAEMFHGCRDSERALSVPR